MTEEILLSLWLGTLVFACIFFGFKEMKDRKDRESHEWWLSDLKECIKSVENEFSRRCFEITEYTFSQYTERLDKLIPSSTVFEYQVDAIFDIIHKHTDSINNLKKQYVDNLYDMVLEQKRITIKTIPDYLIKEYEINLSKIADTHYHFNSLIRNHLMEIKIRRR